MSRAGDVGLALLGLGVVAFLLVWLVAVLPPGLRLWRAFRETRRLVAVYRQSVTMHLLEYEELAADRERLLRPLRRLSRVARHPLMIALYQWYRRRGRRAGTAAAAQTKEAGLA